MIGDELVWSTGVGFADVAARRRPDATTIFRIASITKTFTGTAIMQLALLGGWALMTRPSRTCPSSSAPQSPFGPISTVTVRRLLWHGSGLASNPPGTDLAALLYEGRAFTRASEMATVIPPDTQRKYSDLGYQLQGEVIARVSRKPYPRYVEEEVLVPLGMLATFFPPLPPVRLRDLRAVGYNPRRFSDELEPAPETPESGPREGFGHRWATWPAGPGSSSVLTAHRAGTMRSSTPPPDEPCTRLVTSATRTTRPRPGASPGTRYAEKA